MSRVRRALQRRRRKVWRDERGFGGSWTVEHPFLIEPKIPQSKTPRRLRDAAKPASRGVNSLMLEKIWPSQRINFFDPDPAFMLVALCSKVKVEGLWRQTREETRSYGVLSKDILATRYSNLVTVIITSVYCTLYRKRRADNSANEFPDDQYRIRNIDF